jgi:hypothetical protein
MLYPFYVHKISGHNDNRARIILFIESYKYTKKRETPIKVILKVYAGEIYRSRYGYQNNNCLKTGVYSVFSTIDFFGKWQERSNPRSSVNDTDGGETNSRNDENDMQVLFPA